MTKMLSAVTLGKKGGWAYYQASTVLRTDNITKSSETSGERTGYTPGC